MFDKTTILKEAQKLLAKGAVDKAIAELDKLVKESPDGNIFNMIGDIYLKKGAQKAAVEYYLKAANYFRQEGFSQKAQALYKKVLNINPADTDALFAFGEISEERGLATDAIKYYLATADLLAKEGKKDRILSIYEKILALSPANITLRTKVAEIFIKEGLKTDASREYIHIARIYDEQGDHQKAKDFYQKTIDLQPLNRDAVLGLNYLYEKIGEKQQAVEQIKEAVVLFPEDISVLFRCTDISMKAENSKLAADCLKKITTLEPNNFRARRMLGEIYMNAGSPERAWQQYLPVLDDLVAGMEHEEVVSFISSFKETDPLETGKRLISLYRDAGEIRNAADELISLSNIYEAQGMSDEAGACLSEASEIDPDNPEIHRRNAGTLAAATPPESDTEGFPQGIEMPDLAAFGITEETEEKTYESGPPPSDEGITEEAASDQITIRADKSYDEVITEADIFSRYGLLNEAQRLLEGLKVRFPEDIDVHQRLKSIYTDTQDKESAVTECIILNELYSRLGESENAEKALRDASEINPGDSRLAGREAVQFTGTDEFAVSQAGQQNIEDYEEEIAEADFYSRQGLTTEAVKILERLNRIFPENRNISERLKALGQSGYESEAGEMTGRIELPETAEPETAYREFEFPSEPGETEQAAEEEVGVQEEPQDTTVFKGFEDLESEAEQPVIERFIQDTEPAAEKVPEEKQELTAAPQKEQEFEEFTITEHDLTEAVEMPEPSLDNDVLEIFHEFKKGLEKELGDEDSETHYNLGIAYKEMGLVDDAIKEFQTSKNDPRKFIQSSTLLGVCYMEKGLYTLAIDILKKALDEIREKDEPYRAVQYDLAEAHEKNGDIKEAVELYTEVYGWNAKFRSVSDKMSVLRGQLPKADETARDKAKARKDRVSYL